MKSKYIILIIILLAIGYLGYQYLYQDHRDIAEEVAAYSIASDQVNQEFVTNAEVAETKYLNKTIEITGTVSKIEDNSITLDDVIYCQFTAPLETDIQQNQNVTIKGRFIGYDDLLEYVNLDQCSIKN
ncbi:hypothetical protein [Mesonia sp. K7]|uniref:OB-fold protein n=1 Tax=Mesonia sp. K7 TaxID=2218606 RepID=UPI000DA71CC5|nr:hypothetical protein [Mesonia sp. K7]PZD77891.1 hypothetical protein DNG35_07295 [Mesonia sp. K7]